MDDSLPFLDQAPSRPSAVSSPSTVTDSQRAALRGLFGSLKIPSAKDQFAVVEEMTGQRIDTVQDLTEHNAMKLIFLLTERVKSAARVNTGNAWADREEDTWMDKL